MIESELTLEQIARLAIYLDAQIKNDPDLRWDVAVEQAEAWTLEEYYRQFGGERA